MLNPTDKTNTPKVLLTGLRNGFWTCLVRIWTQAYLEKRLGADFYKVPRATAVRILSVVRESILWILRKHKCTPVSLQHYLQ